MTTTVDKLSYDPKEIIGRGGNGTTVFKGFYYEYPTIHGGADHDEEKKKQVAIKRIQRSYVEGDESNIKHEVDLMITVGHHPNILRYIHSEMDINYLYIATELCRGTMEDFFNGRYDGFEKRIITKKEILRQVTKGLAHLHKLGIVHRDIKPTNILIFELNSEASCNKPQMKLADFNISKILKNNKEYFTNTSVTNPSGTRGWIAPELYKDDRFDFKVDVWALGCIFGYTLSGGKHPYGDDDDRIIRIKQRRDVLLTKKDLLIENQEIVKAFELIKSMLMVDPKIRPTVMDVLKNTFLRDEERTAEFLSLCRSFRDSIKFEELVEDETVDVNARLWGSTPLHCLCEYYAGDDLLHFVQLLIQNGADVNAKDYYEHTPLHLLCRYYNNANLIRAVKLLLEKGAQANVQDNGMADSPLSNLCSSYDKENMLDIVKLLIDNRADVNNKTSFMARFVGVWRNPLCILCRNYRNENLIDIVQFLIENGADVNANVEYGAPLHLLCAYYNNSNLVDIVRFLIQHGALVNAKNGDGSTPLHLICHNYEKRNIKLIIEIAQLLIERGAKINAKNKNGCTPLQYVCQHYKIEDKTEDDDGDAPLHALCIENGKDNLKDIVQLFVEKGAEVNVKNEYGLTPLNSLCETYKNENLIDVVRLLIKKGAKVNDRDDDGNTPLYLLCCNYKNGNLIDIIQLLVEEGAEVNTKNLNGWTPLHTLCFHSTENNIEDILKLLIQQGAEVEPKTQGGSTPLLLLCGKYNNNNLIDVVKHLTENGADINAKDKDGNTSLHLLCRNYDKDNLKDIVQLLIRKGADVQAKNANGYTPLHLLCLCYKNDSSTREEENLKSLVSLFEKSGASIYAENDSGMTPNDYLTNRKISALQLTPQID